ncbi:high frequency lysogenization protein HflD [Nitrosopumilus sp. S4]
MFEELISSISNFTPTMMLGLGFLIGIQHAFEPDHVAAIGTQLFKKTTGNHRKKNKLKTTLAKPSIVGIFWGAGHSTTLLIMSFIVYFFAIGINSKIFTNLELLVGFMLIFLGISAIWKKKVKISHRHPHQHSDGNLHFDSHEHNDDDHRHDHKSYLIGLIHGFAGSGSMVVLAISTLENMELALAFVFLFGLGSFIGMVSVSALLGVPFLLTSRLHFISKFFRYGTAIISLILGMHIIFEIGFLTSF